MKDTVSYPLIPQTGAHWVFPDVYAADSLFRFMGDLSGQRLPELKIGPLHESSRKIKTGDRDLENTINLMRPVPHKYDKLYDAEVTIVKDMVRPTALGTPSPTDGILHVGDDLMVEFKARLRGYRRFASAEDAIRTIKVDLAHIRTASEEPDAGKDF